MLARGLRCEMTARQTTPVEHQSAESRLHRLEPLHPAAVAFLAVQHGVPVSSPPVGPAGGVAATDAGRMTQYCPGARCSSPRLAIRSSVSGKSRDRGGIAYGDRGSLASMQDLHDFQI
jgi:hypothetical protein